MNIAAYSFIKFYKSSIGKKVIVAVTGLALIGFLLGHMIGNLKIYAGADKINSYAAWLHSMPIVLWGARIGLLACFLGTLLQQLCWSFKTDDPRAASMFTNTQIRPQVHPEQ